jgi:PAS domain S-box-containing protein
MEDEQPGADARLRTERKRMEEALRASEERFRALVQLSFDVYWETDEQHRFTRQEFSQRLADAPARGSEIGKARWEVPYLEPDEEAWRQHRAVLDAHLPFRDFELARPTPDGGKRYVSVSGMPMFDEAGRFLGYRGVGRHITELKRAEQEHRAHVWFLESMDRINRAMQVASDLEKTMSEVLEALLDIFVCDRAWLVYPCDPQAASWRVVMERTRPEYPGAFTLQSDIPTDADAAAGFAAARAASGAVLEVPAPLAERFSVRSRMAMAMYPQGDSPYLFGIHQCSHPRAWTADERRLFEEVGHRLTDTLSSLIAVRRLRESERRLEEAQRVAHLGYWDRDLVANRVVLAEESWRIFGVEPHERPADLAEWNRRWRAFILPEDRPRVLAAVQAALAGGPRYDVEFRIVRKDGEVRVIHSQGDVIRDASGRALRMFGTQQDITALRQAEQELRASETRFRALVDHATDGFFLHADDSTVIDVNQQACASLGYGREELIGMHPRQFDTGLDPPSLARITERIGNGEPVAFETLHRRKDGSMFPVEVRVRQFHHGERRLHASLVRDITERKRAEEERRTHVWFLESMDRIHRAMQGTNDVERMMSDVLNAVLEIFGCDRAWLLYPCDPDAPSWRAVMEHVRPQFPGAFALGRDLPMSPDSAEVARAARDSSGALPAGPGHERRVKPQIAERFGVRSEMLMALRPKGDRPYLFGLHQCSQPRSWTKEEQRLFEEIGHRLTDALSSLIAVRSVRESERRLEAAQRLAHVGWWERDYATGHVSLSDEACRIFGVQPLDLPHWHGRWVSLIHPEDREKTAAASDSALAGGTRYDVEYRVVRPDGAVRVVHSQGDVTRDESGRPVRQFGVMQDITELRQAEQELRARQEMLDLAQKAARAVAFDWHIGARENENRWSPELEAMYGLEPGTFDRTYQGWKKLVHPDDWPSVKLAIERANQSGDIDAEYRVIHKGGAVRWLHAKGRMFFDAAHGPERMVGFMIDVSDRRRAEEELRGKDEALQAARAELARVSRVTTLGELTAAIAHEVNQPLGAMVANAAACTRWLAADPPETARARRALESIAADGRRASEIIGRIRALVKRQAPRKDLVDVNLKIAQVIELAADEIRRNGIVLRTELAKGLPRVEGDRVQLQQVLLNLILNAIDAMSAVCDRARELMIVSRRDGPDAVLVEVRDTGPGLEPKHAERLFEPFFTTKAEGLGIGLSISRSIVEAHGGRLWVDANEPHGAVFRFSLPAEEAAR